MNEPPDQPAPVSFGSGYSSLDADPDASLLDYLDAVATVAAVVDAKREATLSLDLGPGQRVLDVGCGTGVDLEGLLDAAGADGEVEGIDPLEAALERARRRLPDRSNLRLRAGRVEALPCPDDGFDACRADRVLQHLADPGLGLAELGRVLRPGGRLSVLEAGSRLDLDGVDADVTALIGRRLMDLERGEWVPLWLPVLLAQAGFLHVRLTTTEAVSHRFEDADTMLRLRSGLAGAVAEGALEEAAARDWLDGAQAAGGTQRLNLRMRFIHFSAVAA